MCPQRLDRVDRRRGGPSGLRRSRPTPIVPVDDDHNDEARDEAERSPRRRSRSAGGERCGARVRSWAASPAAARPRRSGRSDLPAPVGAPQARQRRGPCPCPALSRSRSPASPESGYRRGQNRHPPGGAPAPHGGVRGGLRDDDAVDARGGGRPPGAPPLRARAARLGRRDRRGGDRLLRGHRSGLPADRRADRRHPRAPTAPCCMGYGTGGARRLALHGSGGGPRADRRPADPRGRGGDDLHRGLCLDRRPGAAGASRPGDRPLRTRRLERAQHRAADRFAAPPRGRLLAGLGLRRSGPASRLA